MSNFVVGQEVLCIRSSYYNYGPNVIKGETYTISGIRKYAAGCAIVPIGMGGYAFPDSHFAELQDEVGVEFKKGQYITAEIDCKVIGPYLHHKTGEIIGYHVSIQHGKNRALTYTMIPVDKIQRNG